MDDVVVVKNLGKRFRRYHIDRPATIHEALMKGFRRLAPAEYFWGLQGVSFSIAGGRMVGVLGRNGAGKSTLLRLIGGVGKPDQGSEIGVCEGSFHERIRNVTSRPFLTRRS